MSFRARMCLSSFRLLAILSFVWLTGCATSRNEQTRICPDARCIARAAMAPHFDSCMDTLFRGARGYRSRQVIAAEFGYPFVDASGYFSWRQMGGTGPAPDEWCKHYAREKVGSPYGVRMSLH